MNKLILSLAAIAFSGSAGAQEVTTEPMRVTCTTTENALRMIDKYGESPVVVGTADSSAIVFFSNEKTGTYSVIIMNSTKACLVAAGSKTQIMNRGLKL